jgi:glycosyltransferase domain-containing protein
MSEAPVTILIPSHRRPALLARALVHYAPAGWPVIVADSSPEPFAGAGPGVTYLHLPGVGFEVKLQKMAGMVGTPCAVLCADDDFTCLESIRRCVAFLEANPDHSGAHGHYLRVVRGAEAVVEPCYRDTHTARIVADTAAERLLELNRPYVPLFYAVLRAEVLRLAFGPGHEDEKFYASSELALGMAAAALGKVAVLPTLHTVRDIVPSQDLAGAKSDNLRIVSTDARYAKVYAGFVERMAGVAAREADMEPDAARAAVLASVDGFVQGYCLPGKKRSFVQKLPKYARRMLHTLLPPLAAQARREAAQARAADLEAYLAPVPAETRAELPGILEALKKTAGAA